MKQHRAQTMHGHLIRNVHERCWWTHTKLPNPSNNCPRCRYINCYQYLHSPALTPDFITRIANQKTSIKAWMPLPAKPRMRILKRKPKSRQLRDVYQGLEARLKSTFGAIKEVISVIARGGFGEVRLAISYAGQRLALKSLHGRPRTHIEFREQVSHNLSTC